MAIPLGRSLPSASCDRPERRREGPPGIPASGMPAAPTWSCSRWGFPCRRRCRRRGALLPHRFTLAARPVFRGGRRCTFCGTFPGVAPAGGYPAPHLRGARTFLPPPEGGERPSGRLALGNLGVREAPVKARMDAHAHGRMGFYGLYHLGRARPDWDCTPRVGFYNRCEPIPGTRREGGSPCR